MKLEEFLDFVHKGFPPNHETRQFLEKQIAEIKEEPAPFVVGAIRAQIDFGSYSKDFLLGMLVGFAASDDRVKFK